MSRTVSTLLLDLAAWIAPPHRRPWIAGLRAEAAQAGHSTGWAWGALTTALGQRLADTVASGLALRLALGGFVMSVATGFTVFLIEQMPHLEASAARTHQNLAPPLLMLAAILLALMTGGAAIAFSAGRPWFNRYGRLVFAMESLAAGVSHVGALTDEGHLRHAVTAYWHQQDILATIAGVLLIAAAPALLFRWGRLLPALATGVVGIHIAEWVLERPYLHGLDPTPPFIALFFNVCIPGLLILAASGLLIERRSNATA